MAFKFKRGEYMRDLITGFTGVITVRSDSITTCNRYFLEPGVDKDGKIVDGGWFDENCLEYDHKKLGQKLSLLRTSEDPPG